MRLLTAIILCTVLGGAMAAGRGDGSGRQGELARGIVIDSELTERFGKNWSMPNGPRLGGQWTEGRSGDDWVKGDGGLAWTLLRMNGCLACLPNDPKHQPNDPKMPKANWSLPSKNWLPGIKDSNVDTCSQAVRTLGNSTWREDPYPGDIMSNVTRQYFKECFRSIEQLPKAVQAWIDERVGLLLGPVLSARCTVTFIKKDVALVARHCLPEASWRNGAELTNYGVIGRAARSTSEQNWRRLGIRVLAVGSPASSGDHAFDWALIGPIDVDWDVNGVGDVNELFTSSTIASSEHRAYTLFTWVDRGLLDGGERSSQWTVLSDVTPSCVLGLIEPLRGGHQALHRCQGIKGASGSPVVRIDLNQSLQVEATHAFGIHIGGAKNDLRKLALVSGINMAITVEAALEAVEALPLRK